jgi:hypothetical protein
MKLLCPDCGEPNPDEMHVCMLSTLKRKESLDGYIAQRDQATLN